MRKHNLSIKNWTNPGTFKFITKVSLGANNLTHQLQNDKEHPINCEICGATLFGLASVNIVMSKSESQQDQVSESDTKTTPFVYKSNLFEDDCFSSESEQ